MELLNLQVPMAFTFEHHRGRLRLQQYLDGRAGPFKIINRLLQRCCLGLSFVPVEAMKIKEEQCA